MIPFIYIVGKNGSYFKNVLMTSDGFIRRLPFDSGVSGLWKFDGQFYYLAKEKK